MEITLSRATIRRVLFVTMALVVSAGLAVEALRSAGKLREKTGLLPMFSLSYEQNIPTWYSSALLFSCSLLLAVSALFARRSRAGDVRYWWLLAAAFLYISIDEVACIHEEASRFFALGGVLFFGWVIPAGIIVLALGAAYLRFLLRLPRRTRAQFIVAGAIYVTGALLLELPLGYWTEREGSRNFVYAAIDWVEESLEILGLTLFLLSLLEYLGAAGCRVTLSPPPERGAAEKLAHASSPVEPEALEAPGSKP
jgi:hypothetical protein